MASGAWEGAGGGPLAYPHLISKIAYISKSVTWRAIWILEEQTPEKKLYLKY